MSCTSDYLLLSQCSSLSTLSSSLAKAGERNSDVNHQPLRAQTSLPFAGVDLFCCKNQWITAEALFVPSAGVGGKSMLVWQTLMGTVKCTQVNG